MKTLNKLLVGALCLLLCSVVYARLATVSAELRYSEFDALAHHYASASPQALFTPVKYPARPAEIRNVTPTPGIANELDTEVAPAPNTDARLAVYVDLHRTRLESPPAGAPVFARAFRN